jgi:enoyl-CoA hydratase/carnithine racemase
MDDIRCVILRGAGDQAFAPGNDISEFPSERSNVEQARATARSCTRRSRRCGRCRSR